MQKKKKKKPKKNRYKTISEQQIIKIDFGYTNEETNDDLREEKYYLVTKLTKPRKNKNKLALELFIITTGVKRKFGPQKLIIPHYKIVESPTCLPKTSFISRPRLILLKISLSKYRHHLCGQCSQFCFNEEEFTRIIEDHQRFWTNRLHEPLLETIDLEI